MNNHGCLERFREKFRLNELVILEGEHWILSVRPEQLTFGSMVLSSKNGKLSFGDLTSSEGAGLAVMLGEAEGLAKKKLGAVRINAICLMMKDPIVHFHIFPRYDREFMASGVYWKDTDFPNPILVRSSSTSEDVLDYLVRFLRG